jgi:rhamnosyltransferase
MKPLRSFLFWRWRGNTIKPIHYENSREMTAHSVCAVIVTYNPQPTFMDNIVAVAQQVGHVVVVDNGSSGETQQLLHELQTRLGCSVIRNHQNLGIAAALNLGVNHAIRAGFDWITAFDQDSCVSDGFISQMLATYQEAAHPEKVAIIAPTCVDRESSIQIKMMRSTNGEVLLAMTSGSMMPSSTLRNVGALMSACSWIMWTSNSVFASGGVEC